MERFWPTFAGGAFQQTLYEPAIGGTTNRGYLFRFGAEGYAPQVTRLYQPDEGAVQLDMQLRKAVETVVTLYSPDGSVAVNAQVALLASGAYVTLGQSGFNADLPGLTLAWIRHTDAQGQFRLPQDATIQSIAGFTPDAYADMSVEELVKTHALHLAPWSRVEGNWQTNGQPVANGQIMLRRNSPKPGSPGLSARPCQIRTEAGGNFIFSKSLRPALLN